MTLVQRLVSGFFMCLFSVRVEGRENIPAEGGIVITPNHISNWDPPLIGSISPRRVKIMAKAELFSNKLLSAFFTALGAYPVSRGTSDVEAVKASLRMLKEGEPLLIFPHGRRIKPGEDVPIKDGALMIALRARVNIVPAYISGTYGFRHRITVRFGEQFDLSPYFGKKVPVEEQKKLSAELWERMKALGGSTNK